MRSLVQPPLPQWRQLIAAASQAYSDKELAEAWLRPGEFAFWLSRSAWSLVVIAKCRQLLTESQNITIWLPDFFCNSSLGPLRDIGSAFVFYRITDQLVPDLLDCERLSSQLPIDLFVLVHFFGQIIPTSPFASFCQCTRAWLIEDAAHVLKPVPGIGESADFVLYSPHKLLPIPNGALMIVRPHGPAQLLQNNNFMSVLHQTYSNVCSQNDEFNSSIFWLVKRFAQLCGFRSRAVPQPHTEILLPSNLTLRHASMSRLARRLLTPLCFQLDRMAVQRISNAECWARLLSFLDPEGLSICPKILSTPYLARFTCLSSAHFSLFFHRLTQLGIPVTTWPDLPPEVVMKFPAHHVALSLRNTSFYLPVHQQLTESQHSHLCSSLIKTITADWRIQPLQHDDWEKYWADCFQTNYLQSWQYGSAKQEVEGWIPHRLLIRNEMDRPIALVQVLTKRLPLSVGYIARVNRGPLLLSRISSGRNHALSLLAISALLKYACASRWLLMQIAPELHTSNYSTAALRALGFKSVTGQIFGSARLSLDRSDHDLLMSLNGKWRNCMRKGERSGVVVTQYGPTSEKFYQLLHSYHLLQARNGFSGISDGLIKALSHENGKSWQFNFFAATTSEGLPDRPSRTLGFLVTIRSGDTSTYFIASISDEGRSLQANSVMLWHAILHARKTGCSWFDIGGLNEQTPKGIASFKKGLNASPYMLVGEWRWRQPLLSLLTLGKYAL